VSGPLDLEALLAGELGRLAGGLAPILQAWPEIAGPAIAPHATPVTLRNETLTIRCSNSVWASELLHLAPEILASLRERVPEVTVGTIRCSIRG
jgi:predicted nucleic acid-binding Zn ribbon protein